MNENEWYKIFELLFKTNKESNKNSNGYNSKFYKRYYYIFYINLNLLTLLNSPFLNKNSETVIVLQKADLSKNYGVTLKS